MKGSTDNTGKWQSKPASYPKSRRDILKISLCLGLGTVLGCTPIRILTNNYPGKGQYTEDDTRKTLCAFIKAVIPGVDAENSEAIQVFYDSQFPLAKHRGYFVFELDRQTKHRFGQVHFFELSPEQRTEVLSRGLGSGPIIKSLFNGAIMLTQVAFYAGLYNEKERCSAISFEGKNYGFPADQRFHHDVHKYLSTELTPNGNFS